SCGQLCERILNCANHVCQQECHSGPCDPCTFKVEQSCTCGKCNRIVDCKTVRLDQIETYSCTIHCNFKYACGQHRCEAVCHSHDEGASECPFLPSTLLKCPCGYKSFTLEESLESRAICTDPVIVCDQICWKELKCGHACKLSCHDGPCVCLEKQLVSCRCGATHVTATCAELPTLSTPTCKTQCRSLKTCGRHECGRKCCPKESFDSIQDPHHCDLLCDRILKCGKHKCALDCHRGPCPPCIEASFEPVSCACGKTTLEP
ncbi:hypothetical protein BCR33DRAFT_641501, partial [Rhizoclosmatium globosum]